MAEAERADDGGLEAAPVGAPGAGHPAARAPGPAMLEAEAGLLACGLGGRQGSGPTSREKPLVRNRFGTRV